MFFLLLCLLVARVSSFCTEDCYGAGTKIFYPGTDRVIGYCNDKCMTPECDYAGLEACKLLFPVKYCAEGSLCTLEEYFDPTTECYSDFDAGCPDNPYLERCYDCAFDLASPSKTCTLEEIRALLGDLTESTPSGPSDIRRGSCTDCGKFFSARGATFINYFSDDTNGIINGQNCRAACRGILGNKGECGPEIPFTDRCRNPLCKFCMEAADNAQCPQKLGKADLVSYCATGCSLDQLGNGVCEEACQTVACRFDHEDCERQSCHSWDYDDYKSERTHWSLEISFPFDTLKSCNNELVPFFAFVQGVETLYFPLEAGYCLYYTLDTGSNLCVTTWVYPRNQGPNDDEYMYTVYAGACPVNTCGQGTFETLVGPALLDETVDGHCKLYPVSENSIINSGSFSPYPAVSFRITTHHGEEFEFYGEDEIDFSRPYCDWSQLGNGICDPLCMNDGCYFDLGDCKGRDECDADECPPNFIGNSACDPGCNNANCRYDGGDCFCAPTCPTPLLYNDQCDEGCDNQACDYDWGRCKCGPEDGVKNCTRDMLSMYECQPDCAWEECGYQYGRCTSDEPKVEWDDYSIFTWVIYNQGEFEDDNDCPDLQEYKKQDEVYDNDEYERKPEPEQEPEPYERGWEVSGEPKYFNQCYSSFQYGYYYVEWEDDSDDSDHDLASIHYNCDSFCDKCEDSFEELENEECVMEGDRSIKMKFEYKEPEAASSMLVASLFLFVLKALHLLC